MRKDRDTPITFGIQLTAQGDAQTDIPIDDVAETAMQCLFYMDALFTILSAVNTRLLDSMDSTSLAITIESYCEIGASLCDEAMAHVDRLEDARQSIAEQKKREPKTYVVPMGEKIDRIANILTKTRAHKGDAAEIADDQAVTMIYDLLLTKGGASDESSNQAK